MSFIGTIEYFTAGEDFIEYKERLEHLLTINKVTEDKTKVSYLITLIGPESYKILKSLTAPDKPDTKTFKDLIGIFEKYFSPKVNEIAERFRFYKRNQKQYELISDYIVEIKTLSKSCNFGDFLEDALRDKLVCGLCNGSIQQKLLNETGLTFEKACEIAKSMELTESQMKVIRPETANSVIQVRGRTVKKEEYSRNQNQNRSQSRSRYSSSAHRGKKIIKCYQCGKLGHIKKYCRSKGYQVNAVNEGSNNQENILGLLNNVNFFSEKPVRLNVQINQEVVEMEVDSGACSSVMDYEFFKKKFKELKIEPVEKTLQVVTGHQVEVEGKTNVKIKSLKNSDEYRLELLLIRTGRPFVPLLGRTWLDKLFPGWRNQFLINELSLGKQNFGNDLKSKFPKVFSNNLEEAIVGYEVSLTLKNEEVNPIFCKPYSVPFGVRDKVENEIDRLVSQKILMPVKYSAWASPIVVVPKKNGDIRLCINCKVTINKSIENQVYPLPRIDDILAKFANCSNFCVLDLAGAYQQLSVNENSQPLLTINTLKGLFRYTRLPFGVSVAPAEFQRVMDEVLKGLEKVCCYLDDVLIGGKDKSECETRLLQVLNRLENHNIRVNLEKCKFFEEKVSYLGHEINGLGIQPNRKKIQAIVDAPSPKNVIQLQSFFGLLNFYNRFIPNLSSEMRVLYDLLKKDKKFHWGEEQEIVFKRAKELILNNNILEHYDPNKEIIVTCDASPYGVGAVLAHLVDGAEKPVLFSSSTLNDAQKNYSQTQREALAVIFAVTKFHKYLYGKKFIIHTDHKSLLQIFSNKKELNAVAAARLQRWAIQLSMYDFEIRYQKGKQIGQADALSRLPLGDETEVSDFAINFCTLMSNEGILPDREIIERETRKDKLLTRIIQAFKQGMENNNDRDLKYYISKQEVFSCENNCLYYGNRIVIPETLRYEILKLLHDSHIGIVRMKKLARSHVWWKGLDADIEGFVKSCSACSGIQGAPKKSEISNWNPSNYPFERVHIDFFHFIGREFLIMVDSYSKWIEISEMAKTNATKVIEKLRNWFSVWGIPSIVVSDNGPPFSSGAFIEFCESNNIKVMKSPPYHPQSNGLAERAVQTVKKAFKKFLLETKQNILEFNCKIDNFLLRYRNTPTTTTNESPANVLLKFRPKTLLDFVNDKPGISQKQGQSHRPSIKTTFLKKKFTEYIKGEEIYYQNSFKNNVNWIPGKIVSKLTRCLYEVVVNGVKRVAHIQQLKKRYKKVRFSPFMTAFNNNSENINIRSKDVNRSSSSEVDSDSEEYFSPNEDKLEGENKEKKIEKSTNQYQIRKSDRNRKPVKRLNYEK